LRPHRPAAAADALSAFTISAKNPFAREMAALAKLDYSLPVNAFMKQMAELLGLPAAFFADSGAEMLGLPATWFYDSGAPLKQIGRFPRFFVCRGCSAPHVR
jgi:hypothetical protein